MQRYAGTPCASFLWPGIVCNFSLMFMTLTLLKIASQCFFFGREPKHTGGQETVEQTSVDVFSLSLRKTAGSLPYLVKANVRL